MKNTSLSTIVFNCNNKELDYAVRDALKKTAHHLLEQYNFEFKDLTKISTKTNPELLYSKFVFQVILPNTTTVFGTDYVSGLYRLYQGRHSDDAKSLIYQFLARDEFELEYRVSYQNYLPRGIGPLLIALHGTGLLTLPMSFNWPNKAGGGKDRKATDAGRPFATELLSFIRTLDTQSTDLPDPAFCAVGTQKKRREWFSCYGTKLLLATGWNSVCDANVDDLVELYAAIETNGTSDCVTYPFDLLVDVLWRKYGDRIQVSPTLFEQAVKVTAALSKARTLSGRLSPADPDTTRLATFDSVMRHEASDGYPEALRAIDALPGLTVNFKVLSSTWLDIEKAYLRQLKKENTKSTMLALGWLNVYLFLYLPYWFASQPDTKISFPDCPQKLTSGVFVTRLMELDFPAPETFMSMMNKLQEARQWAGNSTYAVIKQIELFFAFVERKADSLPGSTGFRQPLTRDDFPATTSRKNTNKRPIEKRLFGVVLALTEALITYSEIVTERILSGVLDSRRFQVEISRFGRVIDTFQVAHLAGVVPVLFHNGKTVPLRIIPNVMSFTDITESSSQIRRIWSRLIREPSTMVRL